MRPKNPSRSKLVKNKTSMLQEESNRMQGKLDELKKYLLDKKNGSKGVTTTDSRFVKQMKSFVGAKKKDQLTECLAQLKMEVYQQTLRKTGIVTMKQLRQLKGPQIEKLPIPPGFRIKLKKFLLKSQEPPSQPRQDPDIQQIILKREELNESKKQRSSPSKFQPLQAPKGGQNQDLTGSFLQNLDVEKQMGVYRQPEKEYLNDYFEIQQKSQPRILKSCLRDTKTHPRKKVNWDPSIPDNDSHKTYPKQSFVKELQVQAEQVSVCWECYRRTNQKHINNSHIFCSPKCLAKYNQAMMRPCSGCQRQVSALEIFSSYCLDCIPSHLDVLVKDDLGPQSALEVDELQDFQDVDLSF